MGGERGEERERGGEGESGMEGEGERGMEGEGEGEGESGMEGEGEGEGERDTDCMYVRAEHNRIPQHLPVQTYT